MRQSAIGDWALKLIFSFVPSLGCMYRVVQKNGTISYALTLTNTNRFSQLFHCQNQEKICNNTLQIQPHLKCVATLPCEMSSVLKATIDNKTTSVTTHFKKLTTGNNVFIVSVIV